MSKPIKLTDELISAITAEFVETVKKAKMSDGKVNYTKNFKWEGDEKAQIVFSAVAYAKMVMLIQGFETEVAWHGVVFRDEKEPNRFYISDIMVYPQIVTGGTANTEQIPYQNWLYAHDDEVFNNIRMQGHSHVSYSTNPSSVDIVHQEKILSQIDDDMFYIFMIWNKKFEKTIKIYDLANNTLYETGDVEIYIGDEGCDLNAFVKVSKELVKIQPTTYGYNYGKQQVGFQPQSQSGSNKGGKSKPKDSKKDKPDIGSSGRNYNYGGYYGTDDDDDQYGIYGYGDRFQR